MEPLQILFPLDFSDRSIEALKQATYFSEKTNSKLHIYHVYHQPYSEYGTAEDMNSKLDQLEKQIERNFTKLEKTIPKLKKVNHTFEKESGVSIEKIVEKANTGDFQLIISATKGAKGFGELWGTKTEKIIKEIDVPVLIIPDDTNIDGFRKMGLTCDFSGQTKYESLELFVDLAIQFQSEVDVISLNQDLLGQESHKEEYVEASLNKEMVGRLFEGVDTSFNYTFHPDVHRGIVNYSKENELDLIAILPKAYSFIEEIFHESLTQKMIFHSPVPLLVLK